MPPIEIIPDVIIDGLVIAIVAYTISISMAKIFASKHEYNVFPNQELIANGASNIVGSFFLCAPISASLSRSVIQEQVGGKTQIAGLFSCFILLFVLLWIGPFFETLPHVISKKIFVKTYFLCNKTFSKYVCIFFQCVLSALIVVALKGMFLQIYDLPKAYNESSLNALVWIASFLCTVLLDIEYGLGIGLLFSIFTLVWRSNRPQVSVLGIYSESNVYVDINSIHVRKLFSF